MRFLMRLYQDKFAFCCFVILCLIGMMGLLAEQITAFDPTVTNIREKYQAISQLHWLGTDNLGRDIFSRLIFGIRTTVFYAVIAMVVTLLIGAVVGMSAGLLGQKVDNVLMRLCDIMLSFPAEVMILALVGILGAGIDHILLAIVCVKWAWYARMIRGIVLQHTHKNYVLFAKTVGSSYLHLLIRHLLPVTLAELVILGTADIGSVILMISALSFLGLGVQPPIPEWGNMLADAKNIMVLHPEQMSPAGLSIVVVVMAFNSFGDFLRDYFGRNNEGDDEYFADR
ncbi:ABC transporter permease subunit [Actinobacillus arthritidis]|uniref:ABC transporter permease subunit n=1 Tax=Actinobacillus arthritidis TaxID=157339 RepID=UPI0024411FC6|nr:ABC transporter permease subunit [Actinobacillus arthritidis]WGE90004.1 ABC transporter permease subunit [Actinobacillus arthritidis]